ncbi:MAG TPA: RagB/SusD family nutrient uptake outer membrane protein [Bacteroidales bacterium]|nr:MAG: SusD family protein [Bacteroidetes bacterium ADurb.Bin013]HOF75855.1 RagB/SusD family nutrient uptake outer membrane protein [Bacteroidales bacterium]HOQ95746.1 RagB/SusD family nutrient uptake outer membrane protein [Bacteroidales bacterium]HOZ10802.1 RagB/SusD family nutrient uptake outer membrane protein [Bacteroidales bacterium]HPH80298.1 RagB/SusD family nutrient uptake outer membrane protein [Bacteroidales bacterium]
MNKIILTLGLLVALTLAGCSDFLDRPQKTAMDDSNYWTSETNVRLFVNGGYPNYFNGYDVSWGTAYVPYRGANFNDDMTSSGKQSSFLAAVPADNWYRSESATTIYWLTQSGASAWNFGWVRKWNTLIQRLATMKENGYLSDEQFNHWNGVARLFRGVEYSRLVQSFGNVPYYDKPVSDTDMDEQYKERDPRTLVMDKVYEDFVYAMANIRANDGVNYVNKYVAAALASRYMLFEGTWYKYHPGSGTNELAKKFLELVVTAGNLVINSGLYQFNTDFRSLFGSDAQPGKEILLYREYNSTLSTMHCIASYSNLTESQAPAANLALAKSFICNDGKPWQSSTVAEADNFDLKKMAVTRDPRFEATFWGAPLQSSATLLYVCKFIDRVGVTYSFDNVSTPRPPKYGSNTNTNGFPVIRLAEVVLNWIEAKQELALSHGGPAVTQTDLDKSINAIRNRPLDAHATAEGVKKTAPLMLGAIPDDPARTSSAEVNTLAGVVSSPLLWEIRRERRMEFVFENNRILDLRRWGKLELMNGATNPDLLLGTWCDFNTTQSGNDINFDYLIPGKQINQGDAKALKVMKPDGTVVAYTGTNKEDMVGFYIPQGIQNRDAFTVRSYLQPVCTDVIEMYKDKGYTITQNPGW